MARAYSSRSQPGIAVLIVVATVALASSLLVPVPAAAHAGSGFTFFGGGFGHSVGMSQYGAYGMALEGATWQEIVGHYYTGASPGEVGPTTASAPIWVNLMVEQSSVGFAVRSIGNAAGPPVEFKSSAGSLSAAAGTTVSVTRLPDGSCRVAGPSGGFDGPCAIDAEWDGFSASPATALVIEGCSLLNWNAPGGSQQQPCTYARGILHIRPDNNTNTVDLALEIGMEDYLLGISEMPYAWGSTGGAAALQAQAVAARSYAYARAAWRGDPQSRPWCWCQLYDTPIDQNYVGWGHGTEAWISAVRSTAGQVLFHPEVTRRGQPVPLEAFYSSSSWGRTENSEDSFANPLPYLKVVDDHWAGLPAVGNRNFRWDRTFSGSDLGARIPGLTTVTGAEITACSQSGAALQITFVGDGGSVTVTAKQVRGFLGLRSQQVYRIDSGASSSTCPSRGAPPTTTTTTSAPTTTTTTTPATATTTTAPATTTTTTAASTTTTTSLPPDPPDGDACSGDISALLASPRVLRQGDAGRDVRQLQSFLSALGHYRAPVDGIFGRYTAAAVRSFQGWRGLAIDGLVGSRTKGELAALHGVTSQGITISADGTQLRTGSSGDAVRVLQRVLELLGFTPGPIDGDFGSRTAAAVMAFQRAQAIAVDGIVGPQSRRALAAAFGSLGCG